MKTRFLFTGREWISDLRIYDYRARQYQPELGRFLQPDPKQSDAGDYNLYRYCHSDPVNKSDPMGLISDPGTWNSEAMGQGDPPAYYLTGVAVVGAAMAVPAAIEVGSLALVRFGPAITAATGAGIGKTIQFAQKGISSTFRHGEFAGKSINEVARGLASGTIKANQLPIQTVTRDGITYTLNNRSLMALRQAGQSPTVIKDMTGNPAAEKLLTQRLKELGGKLPDAFVPTVRGQ